VVADLVDHDVSRPGLNVTSADLEGVRTEV